MLLLVFADGDDVGVVKENICRHQHGIEEQTGVDGDLFLRLVLKLRHAFELAERADAGEHPREFVVAVNVALNEEVALFGIESASHVLREAGIGVFAEFGGNFRERDGVLVGYEEIAFVIILHGAPIAHCAEIVPEVEPSRGLSSR